MRERLIAGAMSGTSADGVDVAIVAIAGQGLDMTARLLHHQHRPYSQELKREIFAFRGGDAHVDLARLATLARDISLAYAATVNDALRATNLSGGDLACVAAHGQTLYHAPPLTIQWFDPTIVAAVVGCPVVSDFRRADCAAGGQGAPLVPFADYILFRHPTESRVLLNIGGIANLTYLPAGAQFDQLVAYDTGPGNCISDHLCRTSAPDGPGYDPLGAAALRGQPSMSLQVRVLMHPYFRKSPPKSTDGPEMVHAFEQAVDELGLRPVLSLDDLLATSAAITAQSILHEIERFGRVNAIIVSGGGTRNRAIMDQLRGSGVAIHDVADHGIPADAKEALAFALLGAATLDGVPSNVPSVTGAKRSVVLGSITPRP